MKQFLCLLALAALCTPVRAQSTFPIDDLPETVSALVTEGRFDEAAYAFLADVGEPGTARQYFALGLIQSEAGDHEQAVYSFSRAAELDASWPEPQVEIGRNWIEVGEYEKAVWHLSRVDGSAEAQMLMGEAHLEAGDTENAAYAMTRAVELEADYAPGYLGLGRLYADQERFSEAIYYYSRAVEHGAAEAGYVGMGRVYRRLGYDERAQEYYLLGQEAVSCAASAHLALGELYLGDARSDDARYQFTRAVECNPAEAAAFYHLALLAEEGGDLEAARYAYDRYMASESDPIKAQAVGRRLEVLSSGE